MKKLIFSTVLYKTPIQDIKNILNSIESLSKLLSKENKKIKVDKFLIIDNSKVERSFQEDLNFLNFSFKIEFFSSKQNLGYGGGHNFNLLKQESNKDTWFIALNPDIYFEGKTLISFFEYILSISGISCAAPLIYLPNGNIQYSAKKNPTMASLLISRFSFLKSISLFKKYLNNNQNKFIDYEKKCIEAQFLSGCFLVFPSLIYKKINGFSKKYFLHFEDADIVRRSNLEGKTIHCPYGSVTHIRGRGSHKSLSQQFYLVISYVKYSKTWGFRLF